MSHGEIWPYAHDLPVPLRRNRSEERAVGGVDERVLPDLDRAERRDVAPLAEGDHRGIRSDAGGEQQDREASDKGEPLPAPARAGATPGTSPGRQRRRTAPGAGTPRGAHAAMVATSCLDSSRSLPSLGRYRRPVRGALAASWPALRVFVWSRLALWAVAAATVLAFEGDLNPNRGRWDSPRQHELGAAVDVWSRWDSEWYLRIADSGYDWPSSTPAFFPLYPLLVGGLGRILGGHFLLAGIVVSLAACAIAFALLYRLVRRRFRPDDALRSVVYLALFPTSLFLGAVYAESLFLALAIGTFVLVEERRAGWASVTAGLALLTRPYGVALLPALAVYRVALRPAKA